jgi:hypothetical protein
MREIKNGGKTSTYRLHFERFVIVFPMLDLRQVRPFPKGSIASGLYRHGIRAEADSFQSADRSEAAHRQQAAALSRA